jgi:Na+/alanine symporter
MSILFIINAINEFLWGYIASSLIIIFGTYLTLSSKFFSISKYKRIFAFSFIFFKKKI